MLMQTMHGSFSILQEDVQASVHGRLLDPSTNVREAAVDLIGQFILKCPELINQYYRFVLNVLCFFVIMGWRNTYFCTCQCAAQGTQVVALFWVEGYKNVKFPLSQL